MKTRCQCMTPALSEPGSTFWRTPSHQSMDLMFWYDTAVPHLQSDTYVDVTSPACSKHWPDLYTLSYLRLIKINVCFCILSAVFQLRALLYVLYAFVALNKDYLLTYLAASLFSVTCRSCRLAVGFSCHGVFHCAVDLHVQQWVANKSRDIAELVSGGDLRSSHAHRYHLHHSDVSGHAQGRRSAQPTHRYRY